MTTERKKGEERETMNFLKRGITSIKRRPGKSITLLILIFVLCNAIAGAASVRTALSNTKEALFGGMAPEVRIQMDFSNMVIGDGFQMESLDAKTIEKIGQAAQVKYYDYIQTLNIKGKEIINTMEDNDGANAFWHESMNQLFDLKGGQNPVIQDVQSKKITMIDGRTYTQDEINSGAPVIIISDLVAKKNGLSVGDKITLSIEYIDPQEMQGSSGIINASELNLKTADKECEVIGIFEGKKSVTTDKNGKVTESESPLNNTIYTPNQFIESFKQATQSENQDEIATVFSDITAVFELNNVKELEVFKAENKPLLPNGYAFVDDSSKYKQVEAPLENMSVVAKIVIWAAGIATILIISLLVTLFLRDRRHEMGIYLSLGEKKWKIAGQIVTEVMLIAIIAVTLSIFSGNVLAKQMSTTLLNNQVKEMQKDKISSDNNGMISGSISGGVAGTITTVPSDSQDISELTGELMNTYHVTLDMNTVLLICIIGLGSVLVSTIIPVVYTLRLKPRKVLL